ncbi:unnamed protein product [Ectocarpus sp. 12 AP-2014]
MASERLDAAHRDTEEGGSRVVMGELQRQAQAFEEAVADRTVSPDDFFRLNQAIARAEKEHPPLTTSEADAPAGADGAGKLRALVELHRSDPDTLFSHPQAKKDLQALLPELNEAELRDFVREFVRELDQRHAAQSIGRKVLATLAAPIVAAKAPAPAASPPPADVDGGDEKVSVSDVFRLRGMRFNIELASKVSIKAKTMFVAKCGEPAGSALEKRPARDHAMNEVQAPWTPASGVLEHVYPASYRGLLNEAFDLVVGNNKSGTEREPDRSGLRTGGGGGGGEGKGKGKGKEASTTGSSLSNNDEMHSSRQQPANVRMVDNRFEIFDTLRTGYSGKVKWAINRLTGDVVALKVMDKLPPGDPNTARRFIRLQREVDAMRRCAHHQHVVALKEAIFDVIYPKRNGEAVLAHILVLEPCEKGELFDLLYRGGPVPAVVCKEYFRQLMSGIKFIHDQGVCHRNLKPEILLLDSDFALKISDFYLAASGGEGMMCRSIVGSKSYMAPEVLNQGTGMHQPENQGKGYDGAKADVWSAGVILFTMLAGHPPMENAASNDWWFRALKLNRHDLFWQSHETTLNANNKSGTRLTFPADVKHMVSAMLTVEPAERISVDQIMQLEYVAAPSPNRHLSGEGRVQDPRDALRKEMQARYNYSMASKRLLSTAGSESAATDGSLSEASGASGAAAASASVPCPYDRQIIR